MSSKSAAIVTIGNFDGVHRGHQVLLRQVVDRARVLGLKSFAITFDPHPELVLSPASMLTSLTDANEKSQRIRNVGIDDVWVCPFTRELSRRSPAEFMHMVTERQPLAELWVGSDFALGRDRSGSISVLSELGGAGNWGLHMVPPYRTEGQVVSSTAIRTLISAGAVQGAGELLGRTYQVQGELTDGGGAASLVIPSPRAVPKQGLYVGRFLSTSEPVPDASAAGTLVLLAVPRLATAFVPAVSGGGRHQAVRVVALQDCALRPGPGVAAFLRRLRAWDDAEVRAGTFEPKSEDLVAGRASLNEPPLSVHD